ncbi:MAG: type II toxin-antitoxin system Phd/YefM family antitoxin, partial [Chloroflexi bacterium]|nr:type II toxin-antitoxin system Phd/YefM family antitoxin [Chloroflexota bacterium]
MDGLPTETVSTTSLRKNLKEYLDRVADLGMSYQISRNGSPDVVLISRVDLESIYE